MRGTSVYEQRRNTTDKDHEINNINVLVANDSSGQPAIIGWEYFTNSGMYVQEAPGFGDFWTTLLNSNSVTQTLLNLLAPVGSIVPVSSEQGNTIGTYILRHGGKSGSCFTSKLTV